MLKIEALSSFGTPGTNYQWTRSHMLEDLNILDISLLFYVLYSSIWLLYFCLVSWLLLTWW